ncbi:MAG: hypothetical protein JWO09_2441 [Bacteroidetes bacterium]|nr:hypothetical protein [Bacteroidota bacterium]
MKKLLLSVFAIAAMYNAQSQVVFYEDFDGVAGPTAGGPGTYNFPSGWTLANVDNRTPNAAVSYVNAAWERREDFAGTLTDSAAFSTSYYSPAGTANDWMVTPAIGPLPANTILTWNAVAYDPAYRDGYEVRIMTVAPTGGTGVIGNLITASTVLFSTTAENTTWTAHSVSLAAYAGQTVYVSFRNNAFDKYLLLIDDVKLEVSRPQDAKLVSLDTVPDYTIIPKTQVYNMPTAATVMNNGTNPLINVALRLNVYNGAFTQIYTNTGSAIPSLAPGASASVSAGSYMIPATPDAYYFEYIVTHSTADNYTADDTLYNSIIVDDSVYARDNGNVVGALGIGAGNGGFLGQSFTINAPASLSSITYYVTRGYTGEPTAAVLWNMSAGSPNAVVASTDTITYPDDSARVYTLAISGGDYMLAPGTYAVTAVEFDSTLSLAQASGIFKAGTTWVDWPTSPITGWANNEDFGASFAKSYVLRLNLNPDCSSLAALVSVTNATCVGCPNGTASVSATGGTGSYTYLWTPGGSTTATATGLTAGTYMVTITDGYGCAVTAMATVANPDCSGFMASATSTNTTCVSCTDGTATANATGGTGSATYSWAPTGGTAATATGLAPGTYTVTITDGAGCSSTATATVGTPDCSALLATATSSDASCATCADGSAMVNVTGSTGSVTYMWSPAGGTSASATGLTPGTYTVMVTDSVGCMTTDTVLVDFATGIEAKAVAANTAIYPNPGVDVFTIHIPEQFGNETVITVSNYLGETVYSKAFNSFGNKELNLSSLSAGKYTIRFANSNYVVNKNFTIIK